MTLKNTGFKSFDKIMKRNYVFCCSSCISFNPTSHFKESTHIDFDVEKNDKDPIFKIGDDVRISKCKIIFEKGYTPNWPEDVFIIKIIKENSAMNICKRRP